MQPHRFYLPALTFEEEAIALDGSPAHQIARVLRRRPGDPIVLFGGDGAEHHCRIATIEPGRVRLVRVAVTQPETELPVPVTVAMSLLKADRLAWAVQKLTELGVARLLLFRAERTVRQGEGRAQWERLRRIAIEAAEQSGRVRVPEVIGPLAFVEALAAARAAEAALLLHERADRRLTDALPAQASSIALLIGPEGGFAPPEVAAAAAAGAMPVRLGRTILRAETAAIAATAAVVLTIEGT